MNGPQDQAIGGERRSDEWCYFHAVRFYAAVLATLFRPPRSTEIREMRTLATQECGP